MSEDHLEETSPHQFERDGEDNENQISQTSSPDTSDNQAETPPKRKRSAWRWVLGSLIGLIVFAGLGALGGMQAGIAARQEQESLQSAVEAVAQYQLGLADLEEGRCDIARQRFQYVIELNPSYPEAAARLAEAMLCSAGTAEPPTETALEATPTPDLRGADQLFVDTQAQLGTQNWDGLLNTLDTLRKNFPEYEQLEVDRMYYIAFRNRGVTRILNEGELEGGIFDLNRAENIGLLDVQATSARQWAIWYVIGQSFWEVSWGQAVTFFQFVAPQAPNLHDGHFFTAQQRLATAQVAYADELIQLALYNANLQGWCQADDYLNEAFTHAQPTFAPEIQPTIDWIRIECELNPNQIGATPTPGSN